MIFNRCLKSKNSLGSFGLYLGCIINQTAANVINHGQPACLFKESDRYRYGVYNKKTTFSAIDSVVCSTTRYVCMVQCDVKL